MKLLRLYSQLFWGSYLSRYPRSGLASTWIFSACGVFKRVVGLSFLARSSWCSCGLLALGFSQQTVRNLKLKSKQIYSHECQLMSSFSFPHRRDCCEDGGRSMYERPIYWWKWRKLHSNVVYWRLRRCHTHPWDFLRRVFRGKARFKLVLFMLVVHVIIYSCCIRMEGLSGFEIR